MTSLEKYLFKYVTVIDTDDNVYKGKVDMYCAAEDNDTNEESIGILTEPQNKRGIELYASEIKSIQVETIKAPN